MINQSQLSRKRKISFIDPVGLSTFFITMGGLALGHCAPLHASSQEEKSAPTKLAQAMPLGVNFNECFPVQKLSAQQRAKAEEILLNACDTEALYTLIGGIKPMSSGWATAIFDPQKTNAAELDELRNILRHLRCGDEITAHLTQSARPTGNKIHLQGVFFSRSGLQRELSTHSNFWHQWAITPKTEPAIILMTLEHAQPLLRFRGSGYLYGYPDHAVDFFVQSAQAQQENPDRKTVERQPVHIPTFLRDTNQFVYAVPKGHTFNKSDQELRAKCELILAEYKKRRERFIGQGKPGIVALLRDWFHDGSGHYSPRYAKF